MTLIVIYFHFVLLLFPLSVSKAAPVVPAAARPGPHQPVSYTSSTWYEHTHTNTHLWSVEGCEIRGQLFEANRHRNKSSLILLQIHLKIHTKSKAWCEITLGAVTDPKRVGVGFNAPCAGVDFHVYCIFTHIQIIQLQSFNHATQFLFFFFFFHFWCVCISMKEVLRSFS